MMSTVWASVPCRLDFRHGVAGLLEALLDGAAKREIYQVVSAFNEAFNNVVAHSELGEEHFLEIHAQRVGDRMELRIEDDGIPYAPDFPEDPVDPDPLELDEGGIGLLLIGKCMDEVRYERTDKNVLLMVKQVSAAGDDGVDDA